MSINNTGIGSSSSSAHLPAATLREQLVRPRQAPQVAPAASRPTAPLQKSASPASAGTALPAEPPAGTDPELWSVLSASERTFFAKVGAMGPLTYGRAIDDSTRSKAPALRGGRLDIRG
ncbi:hypothetical protein BH09GEM1_BH09GEM1_12330 [soil metagenome]